MAFRTGCKKAYLHRGQWHRISHRLVFYLRDRGRQRHRNDCRTVTGHQELQIRSAGRAGAYSQALFCIPCHTGYKRAPPRQGRDCRTCRRPVLKARALFVQKRRTGCRTLTDHPAPDYRIVHIFLPCNCLAYHGIVYIFCGFLRQMGGQIR